MKRFFLPTAALCILSGILFVHRAMAINPPSPDPIPAKIEFNRDVRQILSETCFKCHGPDSVTRKAGLRLDQPEGAFAANKDGRTPIVPGNLAKSEVWRRITTDDAEDKMPQVKSGKHLSDRYPQEMD
jgi:hypothetical protein